MRRTLLAAVGLAAAAAVPAADLAGLVAAERAFDAASAESGVRAAFLRFLGESSILLRPAPEDGRAAVEGQPEGEDSLRWYPSAAAISAAGDLGYTTGPYRYTPAGGETRHGHYVTVWREREGRLEVALDGGIPHAPLPVEPALFDPSGRPPAGPPAQTLEQTALVVADQAYSDAIIERGFAGGAREWTGADVRLYRSGQLPVLDRPSAIEDLRAAPAYAAFDRVGAGSARSGDFGYSYGFARRDGAGDWTDAWLRIWQRDGAQWRVTLDMLLPLPPPAADPS